MEINTTSPKNQKLIPKLRFKEFNAEWVASTLGNGIELISGQHLSPLEYNDKGIGVPYFTGPSDFTDEIKNVTKWSNVSNKFGLKNDVLITVKGNGVGTMALQKLNKVAMGRQLMSIRKKTFKTEFVYHFLLTQMNLFIALAAGNLIPGLSREAILSIKLNIPSFPEQQKIASFLSSVDEKIQQLTLKKKLLEQYKKGIMQQLFSGKLRFKDDNGAAYPKWEEKYFYDLLTEVLDFRGRTPIKIGMEWGGDILSLSANNVKDGYIDLNAESNMGSEELYQKWMGGVKLEKGDIVFTMEAPLGKALLVPDNKKYILSQRVVAFKTIDAINNKFLIQLIWSNNFQSNIERLSTGSTAKGINQKSFKKVRVKTPCLKEQNKISDFLSTLDIKIQRTADQISQAQNFKKGLLQQMFT